MAFRPPRAVGPVERGRSLVEVAAWLLSKRCTTEVGQQCDAAPRDRPGKSSGHRTTAPISHTDGLLCLHAPLRHRDTLELQVEHGRRLDQLRLNPHLGWHVRRWRRVRDARDLDREWQANSYLDEHLDVFGERHPLVRDVRLVDAIMPFIEVPVIAGTEVSGGSRSRLRLWPSRQAKARRFEDAWPLARTFSSRRQFDRRMAHGQ